MTESGSAFRVCEVCGVRSSTGFCACSKIGPQTAKDVLIGTVWNGKYKILERLLASTKLNRYLVTHIDDGSKGILEVFFVRIEGNENYFLEDVAALKELKHEGLMNLIDGGLYQDRAFVVMEQFEGSSLAARIEKKSLSQHECLRLISDLMPCLSLFHDRGRVHRSVQSANIFISESWSSKLLYPAIDIRAKVSQDQAQHILDPAQLQASFYMSPEQIMGKKLNFASDIYSMGVVLYEALSGKLPFNGTNPAQVGSRHMCDPPPPFDVVAPDLKIHKSIETAIWKSLEKESNKRYGSMNEFYETLQTALRRY